MRSNPGAIPPQHPSPGNTPFAVAAARDSSPSNLAANGNRGAGAPFESLLEQAREGGTGSDRNGVSEPGSRSRAPHGKQRATALRDKSNQAQPRSEEPSLFVGVHDFRPVESRPAVLELLEGGDAESSPAISPAALENDLGAVMTVPSETASTGAEEPELPSASEVAGEREGPKDALLQWLDPAVESGSTEVSEGVDPPLKEGDGIRGENGLDWGAEETGKLRAGIAGWTSGGAANLTLSGMAPIAGATAAGSLLDGTWSAQHESSVAQNPTDTSSTGPRKAEGVSHSYRDSSVSSLSDPVAMLSLDSSMATPAEVRVDEAAVNSPVRELREGLMEGMLEQSANIRASRADSLDVSIRAGVGTEIAVQFSYVDGVVHAHAQCERGDYQLLTTLWHDLQLNLSKHGISLSTLVPPASESNPNPGSLAGGLGSGSDTGARWGRNTRPSREEFLAETSSPTRVPGSVGGWLKLQSRRLFETWA